MCGPNGVALRPTEAPAPEPPPEPMFGVVVDRYLTEYAPSAISPSTLDGYRSKLRTHVTPRLRDLPVSEAFEVAKSREIDVAMVEAGCAVSTRRQVFLALRSVARFAVEAKILTQEPKYLKLPKCGKRVPTAPSSQDVAAMIDCATRPEHRLVILLAAHAGLRKGRSGPCGAGTSSWSTTGSSCASRVIATTRGRRSRGTSGRCRSRPSFARPSSRRAFRSARRRKRRR
ncbi:Hypothetical protein A7982_03852 [Minicystis rosea]|nr:Hypothetical protein A7982_03852 [Minicystis rosea]